MGLFHDRAARSLPSRPSHSARTSPHCPTHLRTARAHASTPHTKALAWHTHTHTHPAQAHRHAPLAGAGQDRCQDKRLGAPKWPRVSGRLAARIDCPGPGSQRWSMEVTTQRGCSGLRPIKMGCPLAPAGVACPRQPHRRNAPSHPIYIFFRLFPPTTNLRGRPYAHADTRKQDTTLRTPQLQGAGRNDGGALPGAPSGHRRDPSRRDTHVPARWHLSIALSLGKVRSPALLPTSSPAHCFGRKPLPFLAKSPPPPRPVTPTPA